MKEKSDEKQKIKIDEQIDALIEWRKKYPGVVITPMGLKDLLRKYGKTEQEKDEILKEYDKISRYYDYVRVRKSRGKLSEEQIKRCTDAHIGGVFDSKLYVDSEGLMEKFGLKEDAIKFIMREYGSIDNFRKVYIDAMVNQNVDEVIPKKILDEVNLIREFDVGSPDWIVHDEIMADLQYDLFGEKYLFNNYKSLREQYKKLLNESGEFKEQTVKVMSMLYGLNGEKKQNLVQIGNQLDVSKEHVRQIKEKHLRKLRHPLMSKKLGWNDRIFEIDDDLKKDIIKEYFKNHDIFMTSEVIPMDENVMNKLNSMHNDAVKRTKRRKDDVDIIFNRFSEEARIELYKGLYGSEPEGSFNIDSKDTDSCFVQAKIIEHYTDNYDYEEFDEQCVRNALEERINQCTSFSKEQANDLRKTVRKNIHDVIINKIDNEIANLRSTDDVNLLGEIWVEYMDFSIRTYNRLRKAGISKITDFIGKTKKENIKYLGKLSYEEVIVKLKNYEVEYVGDTMKYVGKKGKIAELNRLIMDSKVLSDEEKEKYKKVLDAFEDTDLVQSSQDNSDEDKENLIKHILEQQDTIAAQEEEIRALNEQEKEDR